MSTYSVQPSLQTPAGPRAFVIIGYALAVFFATQILVLLVFGLPLLLFPSLGICIAGMLIGLVLNLLERDDQNGGPPPFLSSAFMLLAICAIIGCAFWYAHLQPNGRVAIAFAFAAALAWALSVAGTLLWTGLAWWIMHARWNSWFNFFAAGFAALAAGYTPP